MVSRKAKLSQLDVPTESKEQPAGGLPVAEQNADQGTKRVEHKGGNRFTAQLLERIHDANSTLDARDAVPVTIVIPAWLRGEQDIIWMIEALDSVITQTVSCKAVIVENGSFFLPDVDGGLISIIHSAKGLSIARNAGIRKANTEFFFPLDCNDWLPQNAIQTVYSKRTESGFVYGSTMLFNQARGMGDQHLYEAQPYSFQEVTKMVYFPNGALQRKADWEKIGGYRETLPFLEDWDYWITAGELGICGTAIRDVIYWYRQHGGMVATNNRTPEWENVKKLIQSYHKETYRGVYSAMCCGNKTKNAPPYTPPTVQSLSMPGGDGMLLIEYTGGNVGKMPYYGAITGTRYVVGGSQRRLYIDVRDALTGLKANPGFLELVDHGTPLFTQVAT